jgi:hypothetical protein
MNISVLLERSGRSVAAGFSRSDLVVLAGGLGLLCWLWLPALGREGDDADSLVCQANLRRVVEAMAAFASDNQDALPHPSWGSIGSGPGPDNWCYATARAGMEIPSAALAGGPFAYSAQMPFYEAGQLAGYLGNQRSLVCPLDWRLSMLDGVEANWYQHRALKLTSYTMSGAVSGYGSPKQLPGAANGETYKLSAFPPTGWLFWEADERSPFNWNDAATNPLNGVEGSTQRHLGWRVQVEGVELGVSMVGRLDGGVDFRTRLDFSGLRAAPRPNDLLCGPGYW